MAKSDNKSEVKVNRVFEQPSDAPTFYSDLAQVSATKNEVILQFYQTIPGPPGSNGPVSEVTTRLRATVTVSIPHAKKIGQVLLERNG